MITIKSDWFYTEASLFMCHSHPFLTKSAGGLLYAQPWTEKKSDCMYK